VDSLGFSPLQAGFSFLPMTAALFAVSRLSPRLTARFSAKGLMVTGLLPEVCGIIRLSRISPGSSYPAGVLGPMLLTAKADGEPRPQSMTKTRSSTMSAEEIPPRPATGIGAPAVPSSTNSVATLTSCFRCLLMIPLRHDAMGFFQPRADTRHPAGPPAMIS
jgi:hypothetical protein